MRILHVLGRLDRGGAETMVMNLYRHMDRRRLQFDFVIHTQDRCDYTEEILALGGRIFSMFPFRVSTAAFYCRQWRRFFREHPEYTVIHGHMRSTASLYFYEARRAGRITIIHSHNTSSGKGIPALVKNTLQYPLRFQADYLFACSRAAGIWLYGRRACEKENFRVVLNGIEPERFRFDEEVRKAGRKELLSLTDTERGGPVFLHVGRLETQKNHEFLLRIMVQILKYRPDARLWLCGCGPLEEALKKQAAESGVGEAVQFLGTRTDIPALMQAADGMIFPSLFEGLPVTLVEAQAAGLPVLMSDTVTKEVILTDLVSILSLAQEADAWAQAAIGMTERAEGNSSRPNDRQAYADAVRHSGYDAAENARELALFYGSVSRGAGRTDRI